MGNLLDETGVSWLMTKIKSTFLTTEDAEAVDLVSIDSVPTQNSTNLVESGGVYTALAGKENASNKVTSWGQITYDTKYPSEKLVKDSLDNKYDKAGGKINGDVDITGKFTLDIQDPTNTVGISLLQRLDTVRQATVLTLSGFSVQPGTPSIATGYFTAIERVATPVDANDAANKGYVDGKISDQFFCVSATYDNQTLTVQNNAYADIYQAVTDNKKCYMVLEDDDEGDIYTLRLTSWEDHSSHGSNGDCFVFSGTTDGRTIRTIRIDNKESIYSVSGIQSSGNLVTSISSASTDTQYPSAKCMYDIVGDIETLLAAI